MLAVPCSVLSGGVCRAGLLCCCPMQGNWAVGKAGVVLPPCRTSQGCGLLESRVQHLQPFPVPKQPLPPRILRLPPLPSAARCGRLWAESRWLHLRHHHPQAT